MVPGSRSLPHQEAMEAREEMVAGTETESVHLQWQVASRGSTLGMVGVFQRLTPVTDFLQQGHTL